jgi:glutamate carboxypeptidase
MTIYDTITDFLKGKEPEMFRLLREMVLIQSGSYNKKGIDRVVRLIQSAFKNNKVFCHVVEQKTFGNHLVVRSFHKTPPSIQVLLVGHMDTVFPEDTPFNWYKEDKNNSYGPGVSDMKGGLVTGIFAIKALEFAGLLEKIPIAFLFNSDEEIGSISSRKLIENEAKNSAFAFVLESGGLEGELVTGRKGRISARLDVKGKAGHAAYAGKNKASAILELAHKTIAFESLNDHERGITVNVGKINGGIGSNTIPESSTAFIDFRFSSIEDKKHLEEKINDIRLKQHIPDTSCKIEILTSRNPMNQSTANRELFNTVKNVAKSLNMSLKEEFRAGASDANLIAQYNIPVIDGLGPIGGKDHSEDEYMIKESLFQRTALLACSIDKCFKIFEAIRP